MKLISPTGVKVSVRDELGEYLLKRGYTRAEETQSAPADSPKKNRKATNKEA